MKNFFVKMHSLVLLVMFLFTSLPLMAQDVTSVFGNWYGENSRGAAVQVYLHADEKTDNFVHMAEEECYGGIAVANEYFEYVNYYIFTNVDGEDDKVEVVFTKQDVDGNKVSEGTLTASLVDGKLVLSSEENFYATQLNIVEPYVGETISGGGITGEDIKNFFLGLLFLVALLGSMGHMIYILTRPKRFPRPYTVDDFKEMRRAARKNTEATEEENALAAEALECSFETWTPFVNEQGEDDACPTSKKMVDATELAINTAISAMPTDPEVVEYLNAVGENLNGQWQRKFSGNKMLIGIAVVLLVLMIFAAGWQAAPFFIFSLALYILSCFKPTFMHNKDAFKKGGTFSSGCLAAIFGFIASAQTVRTVTKWNDGTTTVDDDHSQHWMHLALGLIVLVLIGFFLFVWALINYLRNYVLYW